MKNYTDRSTEALLARRAIAEESTPEFIREGYCVTEGSNRRDPHLEEGPGVGSGSADAAHIAANDPTTVMADIDEILRLRAKVERMERWAEAECAARKCYRRILYFLIQAVDNAGFEIATSETSTSAFEEANSLQQAADDARKAVEEA